MNSSTVKHIKTAIHIMIILILTVYFILSSSIVTCNNFNSISRLHFKFKPLVGLPKFLKLHIMVAFESSTTSSQSYLLDFLPINATSPIIIARLLSLRSAPGEIRIKKSASKNEDSKLLYLDNQKSVPKEFVEESDISGDLSGKENESGDIFASMLISGFNDEIHLGFNNCYHFAFYCYLRSIQLRK